MFIATKWSTSLLLVGSVFSMAACSHGPKDSDWSTYNHGYDSQRYADLTQITRENVSTLARCVRYNLAKKAAFKVARWCTVTRSSSRRRTRPWRSTQRTAR